MFVCATHGCSEAFAGVCDEPLFCSVCGMDLTPLCAVTWLGHERNMGPILAAVERALQRDFERAIVGGYTPEDTLAQVVEQYRRRGVPAIRARFEDDGIVVEVARPAGYG